MEHMTEIVVRRATAADRTRLGEMAGKLVRLHYGFDPQRFLLLENVEEGYGKWLVKESGRDAAVVLVAAQGDEIVGYLYGAEEPRSYNDLLDACGYVHDVWVEEPARRHGTAAALVERACAIFKERGAPRVVLMAATKNETAQRLFGRLGFRSTMIEMTREL
jgi:ribosomal protein S18 acetylase RimI-like enzyme